MKTAADQSRTDSGVAVEKWLRMFRRMQMIRLFEEHVNELYTRALMPGLAHLYVGEEAVAVGICEALRPDDYITSTHRGHGHCLAKGASPDRMFAELLGKEAGYCRGKGGSMHIADPTTGNLGANAIVAGSTGIATGAAFSSKHLGTGQVTVCFFGEGALGQGVLYEVMNLAALWKLPVIYACENNLYNEYTHFSRRRQPATFWRAARHSAYPAESVDGQDIRAVHAVASRNSSIARAGERARISCCATPTAITGHHVGDVNREYYRAKQEEQEWKTQRDPIQLLADWLLGQQTGRSRRSRSHRIRRSNRKSQSAVDFAVCTRLIPAPTRWSRTCMPESSRTRIDVGGSSA